MKEQWNISESNILANMEEGLYQKKQQRTKESKYKINYCTQCMPYLRFIFLFEIMLFFGWGCYMILQTYHSREIKNETINITFDRYSSMIESLSSEIQKSRPDTEMPVKPEIIIDKISNILEDMKFTKDPMQNEAIENVFRMQTNMQNSNNVRNNNMGSIVNGLFATRLSGNLMNDKKFTKNSVPEKFFSFESIDEDDRNDKNNFGLTSFLEKLQNISKMKATNDLEQFESRNDVNHFALEKNTLIASNKLENLELNAAISNPENFVDHMISVDLANIFQDPKQEFSDLIKDAAQDENGSLYKETDERVNARLELDLVPRYPKFFDILKDSVTVSSISQPLLVQKISEIENESSGDIDEGSKDKHDINDSDMLMSASVPEDQDYVDISMATMQNTEKQHSSETIATIKEDDKHESMENIKNPFRFLQPAVQDSVEFLTPNIDDIDESNKFQWFNGPPSFVDLGLGDMSELSEIRGSLLRDMDTYEDMDVDDIIPGSQCKITIEMDILKVTCPDIKFDEEWKFTLSEVPLSKVPQIDVPEIINFGDVFDIYLHTECDENISNENSDKEVTALRDNVSKIINATELQESTTNAKIPNVFQMLLDLTSSDEAAIELFDSEEISQDYIIYDSFYDFNDDDFNDKVEQITTVSPSVSEFGSSIIDSNKGQNPFLDISDTQQEQLEVNKEQDYSVPDNNETSLKAFELFYALKKELISLLKDEISDIMTRYLPKSSYENNYRNNICSIFRYMRSIYQHPWRGQYGALSELLENIQNSDYPRDMDDSHRKKRMTDHLTWQQDQISNTLEEDNDVNSLENLRKIFQKMEILTLCIDRLHERYLLHNKLDDYASSEFPLESKALDTSRIVYEK